MADDLADLFGMTMREALRDRPKTERRVTMATVIGVGSDSATVEFDGDEDAQPIEVTPLGPVAVGSRVLIDFTPGGGAYILGTPGVADTTPSCRVSATTPPSVINTGGYATLHFDGPDEWDVGGMHDPAGVNPGPNERIVAPIDGIYAITLTVRWDSLGGGTGYRALRFDHSVDGTIAIDSTNGNPNLPSGPVPTFQTMSTQWWFNAGEFIVVAFAQTSTTASPLSINVVRPYSPQLAMTWLRDAPS